MLTHSDNADVNLSDDFGCNLLHYLSIYNVKSKKVYDIIAKLRIDKNKKTIKEKKIYYRLNKIEFSSNLSPKDYANKQILVIKDIINEKKLNIKYLKYVEKGEKKYEIEILNAKKRNKERFNAIPTIDDVEDEIKDLENDLQDKLKFVKFLDEII